MQIFKKIMVTCLSICIAATLAFVLVNFSDEKIHPAAAAALAQKYEVPPQAVGGYKYLLGLRVPLNQNPQTKGEDIYHRIQKANAAQAPMEERVLTAEETSLKMEPLTPLFSAYITKVDFEKHRAEFDRILLESRPFLERFDHVLAFGSYGVDLEPTIHSSNVSVNLLLQMSRRKMVEINWLLHQKQTDRAIQELVKMNRFFAESTRFPDTLLGIMVKMVALKTSQDFITAAAPEYPQIKNAQVMASLRPPGDFDSLVNKSINYEFKVMAGLLHGGFRLQDFESEALDPWRWLEVLKSLTYKPNRTINLYFATLQNTVKCIDGDDSCDPVPKTPFFVNPLGQSLVRALMIPPQRFKMLKKNYVSVGNDISVQ